MSNPSRQSPLASFAWPDFRRLYALTATSTVASRALAVVLGYEVYALTKSPLALGGLGLVEAIPALSLALYGGHVADRRDRRLILRSTLLALVICALALAALEALSREHVQLLVLYAVVFIAGIARGFSEPAAAALEAQVVPWELLVNSSTLMATCWLSAAVIGPLIGGYAFTILGAKWTYALIALLYAVAWMAAGGIGPKPVPSPPADESLWESIAQGVRYVAGDQVLLASMALDLFAVLFGGAIALLPVFASDILHVGAQGLGALNAAPMLGALLTMLWAARHPPVRHAGRNLFVAVAGFGVAMIVFALSRSLYVSLAALFVSGMCDGVSVVIRKAILRLLSPDHLRGRIAAVSSIFIGSSNELGAFESGMAAALLGVTRSVWLGGIATLMVVGAVAMRAPKLRRLSLDPQRAQDAELEQELEVGEPAAG